MLTTLGHCETMRYGFCFWSAALTLVALASACGSSGDGTVPDAVGGTSSAGKGGGGKGGASGKAGSSTGGGVGGVGGSVGGTSTGGSSGEGGGAGDDRPGAGGVEQCAATSQAAKLTPANLLFVIDKSGSMNCNPPEGDE